MAFFTFKQGAIDKAELLPVQDFANADIKESVLRDLLVRHLDKLELEKQLMVLACEYSNWSDAKRSIDVLALDKGKNLVAVEIKRTKDGGHAELQALRYAAMLSTHTFKNTVNALHTHRQKTNPQVTREQALAELLTFLDETDESQVVISSMPRIMLVSQGFSSEITTTVLWLIEHTEIDISCHTVALYKYGDEFALHFDLFLPLPQQSEYLVKVRDKNIEEVKQAEAVQRRQRACDLLEARGQLHVNDPLTLVRLPNQKMMITDKTQERATYLGGGRIRWEHNGKKYNSPTHLTLELCDLHGMPPSSGTIQGTAHWGKAGGNASFAQAAIAGEQKSISLDF